MRRETYEEKEVKKVERVVTSKTVTCNKCGTTQTNNCWNSTDDDYFFSNDIHNIQLGFGYGSKFDMDNWSFDLCDNCLEELVKTFKYPPDGFMEDGYSIIESEEEKQKVFDHYKETGDWDELRFKPYEELVKLAGYYEVNYINEVIKEMHPNKPLIEDLD